LNDSQLFSQDLFLQFQIENFSLAKLLRKIVLRQVVVGFFET